MNGSVWRSERGGAERTGAGKVDAIMSARKRGHASIASVLGGVAILASLRTTREALSVEPACLLE